MNTGFLLVILILWTDPTWPLERRYEVRPVGHYNTREACERRRQELMNSSSAPSNRMLWSECRSVQ